MEADHIGMLVLAAAGYEIAKMDGDWRFNHDNGQFRILLPYSSLGEEETRASIATQGHGRGIRSLRTSN